MSNENLIPSDRISWLTNGHPRDIMFKHAKNGANENGERALRFLKTIQREREKEQSDSDELNACIWRP